jgi:DNA-binding CsgD family transcriptional regulator
VARCRPLEDQVDHSESSDPLAALLDQVEDAERKERLGRLLEDATPRQRQLLGLIAEGHTAASAARELGISPNTAHVQLHRLRKAM